MAGWVSLSLNGVSGPYLEADVNDAPIEITSFDTT
jgi:hypothetical protein